LEKLYANVEHLNLELYQKLLLVYSENQFDNKLIDTFLRLLEDAPDRPEVLSWVRIALDSSLRCDRSEEVEDALRHALRFHRNLKTAEPLEALVRAWESARFSRPSN
jgi:hypothetical protein